MNIDSFLRLPDGSLTWIGKLSRSFPKDSLRRRFASGIFWSMLGTVLSQCLNLVSSIVAAQLLGKKGFGEFGIINSTVSTIGIFAGFGLGLTATKYIAELRHKDPVRAGRILGLSQLSALVSGGIASLIFFMIAPLLATKMLNAPHLVTELRIGCGILLFSTLSGVQVGSLAGFESFRTTARANFWAGIINFPFVLAGVFFFGLRGLVAGMLASTILGCLIYYVTLRREAIKAGITFLYKGVTSELTVLWNFSVPSLFSTLMASPAIWLAYALLVNQPNGYSEMGVFNAANQWRAMILFIPDIVGQAIVPMMSSLYGSNDIAATRRVLLASMGINALVVVPIALLLIMGSNIVMSFYGAEFSGRGNVLSVIALTIALLAIEAPVGKILAATGRMWLGVCMNFGWALVFLGSNALLQKKGYGADGLATAFLIAYIVHGVWTFWYAYTVVRPSIAPCAVPTHRDA